MTQISKKIQIGGWSKKPWASVRTRINRLLKTDDSYPLRARKTKFRCKKNKGDHTPVRVYPNDELNPKSKVQQLANLFRPRPDKPWSWKPYGTAVCECSACGKILFEYEKEVKKQEKELRAMQTSQAGDGKPLEA